MKPFLFILRTLLLLVLSLPLLLAVMMLSREPLVPATPPLTSQETDRVQQLLIDNDPRRLLDEQEQRIILKEGDADVLLRYLLAETGLDREVHGRIDIEEGLAILELSSSLPASWLDTWLNIRITFRDDRQPLIIADARIGTLELPAPLLDFLLDDFLTRFADDPNVRMLTSLVDTIEHVDLNPDLVVITGQWNDDGISMFSEQARDFLLSAEEQDLIGDYYHLLIDTETALLAENRERVSLNVLMAPLFQQAFERAMDGIDPVRENRALLLALALYMSDMDLDRLVGEADETISNHQRRVMVTLHSRLDLAQHLAISAAISASASASLAEIISVYKEVHDARYRSGFSFDDLTANQTGIALGNIATADHSSAHRLQRMLRGVSDENQYMPDITQAEVMNESAFAEYYSDQQSEAFVERLEGINDSIVERPVFAAFERDLSGI